MIWIKLNPVTIFISNKITSSILINDYKYLILSFEEAILQHIHCESNLCEAKEGHNLLDTFSLYITLPHFVVSQVVAYILRISLILAYS